MWHQPCNNQIVLQVHHFEGFSKMRYKKASVTHPKHVTRAQEQGIMLYKSNNNNNLSKTVSHEQFSLFEADRIESEWNEREKEKREKREQGSSSSSGWILMSCQLHRVTSGQSNSGHKQIHSSKLFSYIYISALCQVNLQNQELHKHKS